MKTTMNISDALFAELKRRAAEEGRTVTSLVEQALRVAINEPAVARSPRRLPSWASGSSDGYLVDLDDRDALWAILDGPA